VSADNIDIKTHVFSPGGPDRVADPRSRTACGLEAKGRAMRRRRFFVEERGRRRCPLCVAKLLLEELRR
jgi:hypothetical protein